MDLTVHKNGKEVVKKTEFFNGKDQSSLKEILEMYVSYASKKL